MYTYMRLHRQDIDAPDHRHLRACVRSHAGAASVIIIMIQLISITMVIIIVIIMMVIMISIIFV